MDDMRFADQATCAAIDGSQIVVCPICEQLVTMEIIV